jgi:hypothetical protein
MSVQDRGRQRERKSQEAGHDGPPIEADSSTEYWAEAGCSSSRGLYVNGGFDSQAGCVMQLSPPYADVPKFSNGQPAHRRRPVVNMDSD